MCICMCMYICICMCVCRRMYACRYVCAYIYIDEGAQAQLSHWLGPSGRRPSRLAQRQFRFSFIFIYIYIYIYICGIYMTNIYNI